MKSIAVSTVIPLALLASAPETNAFGLVSQNHNVKSMTSRAGWVTNTHDFGCRCGACSTCQSSSTAVGGFLNSHVKITTSALASHASDCECLSCTGQSHPTNCKCASCLNSSHSAGCQCGSCLSANSRSPRHSPGCQCASCQSNNHDSGCKCPSCTS